MNEADAWWSDLNRSLRRRDVNGARAAAQSLLDWLAMQGPPPAGLTAEQLQEVCNDVLSRCEKRKCYGFLIPAFDATGTDQTFFLLIENNYRLQPSAMTKSLGLVCKEVKKASG